MHSDLDAKIFHFFPPGFMLLIYAVKVDLKVYLNLGQKIWARMQKMLYFLRMKLSRAEEWTVSKIDGTTTDRIHTSMKRVVEFRCVSGEIQ